jgi:molybdopterin-binding protein
MELSARNQLDGTIRSDLTEGDQVTVIVKATEVMIATRP